MEPIKLNRPASLPSPRLARLTRHLTARLLDFDPGGPQILWADEERGQSPWTMYGAVSLKFYSAAPRRTPSGGVISYYGRGI